MFYRLSNTCELVDIEQELNATFRFPNLYKPKAKINGLEESNLPIITSKDKTKIDYAIWGLLPEDYDDQWEAFQDVTNTLNTNIYDENLSDTIYAKALDKRRCLIIVNGFFTSHVKKGKLYLNYVYLKKYKPFCIAGIFNKINDGFLTCSLLVTHSSMEFEGIPNLGKLKPLIFKKKDYTTWLNTELSFESLKPLIDTHDHYNFLSETIETNFDKQLDDFKSVVGGDFNRPRMKIS